MMDGSSAVANAMILMLEGAGAVPAETFIDHPNP